MWWQTTAAPPNAFRNSCELPLPAGMETVQMGLQKQANEVSVQWTKAYFELKNPSPHKQSQMIRRI
jgi:hypothetical protein